MEHHVPTVFIVEDDNGIAELLTNKITGSGYKTDRAVSAAEALEYLKHNSPDLMILDYILFDMNGKELLSEIDKQGLTTPPFVIITGHEDLRVAVEMMKLGARDFIIKDLHFLDLIPETVGLIINKLENERKLRETEKALADSEIKFRAVFENSRDAISVAVESKHIFVNRACLKMFGYEREEELVNTSIFNLIAPAQIDVVKGYLIKKASENLFANYEIKGIKKDKTEFDMEVSVSTYQINSEVYNLFILRDITQRKKAEETLRENQRALDTLFSNLPGMAYRCINDELWTMEYISSGVFDLSGYKPEEIINNQVLSYAELIHPEDRAMVSEIVNKAVDKREYFELVYRILDIDKKEKWVWEKGCGIFSNKNELIALEGFVTDITKRKLAEEELQSKQYFLSKAQEIGVFGTWEMDIKKNVLRWTDENYKIFGIPIGTELNYEIFLECVHPADRDYVNNKWKSALGGSPFDIEHRLLVDSRVKWVREKADLKFDKKGNCTWAVGVTQEITERKLAEAAIIEAQRLSAIGEMSSAVAHDFNNSLQSIFGNLELALLEPDIPGPVKNYLKTIKTAASDAATRVQQLQRFGGKVKSKKNYTNCLINNLVEEVITQSRPLWKDNAEKNGIKISIEKDLKDIPKIHCNEGEIRSVLYNIVKNSIEAMPEGGTVSIGTKFLERKSYITITDTGTGMDEKTRARIFQPFFSTKGFEIGRGLGMSNAFSIVEEHGGKIYVKNTIPGQGTTIEILLPVSEDAEIAEDTLPENYSETGINILWVDDEVMIRETGQKALEKMGNSCDIAANGLKALELLDKNKYDLVITDIGMPEMNGWQLAEKINEKFNGSMNIAVLSGWGLQVEDEQLKRYNVSYLLTKPFRLMQLKELIEKVKVSQNS